VLVKTIYSPYEISSSQLYKIKKINKIKIKKRARKICTKHAVMLHAVNLRMLVFSSCKVMFS